ncbi:unnamed protein product [Strongylus vulgaris]|uniref:Enoyl-CoA hydratase n=1 Tax=Strongylus vulgaris TaxID=40348 RepID=A0A3P7J3J8_STRVU|nr:unnamed protein product [Strongylus vulgaris]
MLLLRRSLSTASSLIGRELYQVRQKRNERFSDFAFLKNLGNGLSFQGESVVRLILKDVKRRNALSLEMIEALTKELEGVNTIPKVRSVILTSEGPAFSSGHDLRELKAEAGFDLHQKIFEHCGNLMLLIRRMEIPVIAEVRGIAAAAGCQLVASCDVVVASDTSKFVVPG